MWPHLSQSTGFIAFTSLLRSHHRPGSVDDCVTCNCISGFCICATSCICTLTPTVRISGVGINSGSDSADPVYIIYGRMFFLLRLLAKNFRSIGYGYDVVGISFVPQPPKRHPNFNTIRLHGAPTKRNVRLPAHRPSKRLLLHLDVEPRHRHVLNAKRSERLNINR